MSGRAVGGAGCVRGRGLLRGCGCVALLPCDLALRGIHRHLPDSEGPGAIVEQGQNGVECSHSVLKENCAEETLVSPSSPEPAGTLPSAGGRALPPSSCCAPQPLLHCCSCPGSINLSQGWGEDGDKEKRGLMHVSG